MDIIDFLKNDPGARLTYYRQWMIWNEHDQCWEVYTNATGTRQMLIETADEEEAISNLIYE